MSDHPHILTAERVRFTYPDGPDVLHGVDLAARQGRLTCILGPNGSGKTTLLRCLLGWYAPTDGQIALNGRQLSDHRPKDRARQLAYVPQVPTSAFGFTVRELILMGRLAHAGPLGLAGEDDRKVADLAMEMTGTVELGGRGLEELSGGEAQCAMIARALAQQPSVMLLDEPTSHLDIANQLRIYRMMQRLAHDWQMAVVCVSHDVNLAGRFADELILLKGGQVIADGPGDRVIRPDVLETVYGVSVTLVDAPQGGQKLIWAE
jgi:iron complex transport system ATP-binding protein